MVKAIKTEKAPARSKFKASKAKGWVLGLKLTLQYAFSGRRTEEYCWVKVRACKGWRC